MPVESATYVSDLDVNQPVAGDPVAEGDNHLRLIKQALKTTFPAAGVNAGLTPAADLASSSSGKGAELVGFIQAGTGAVSRTVKAKVRDIVSVNDFGAIGDGVTSDQASIVAAVAHCYGAGAYLEWSEGIYLTTGNIPNFHDVRHRGPGVVKRGSDLFYPGLRAATRNTLYVAASGGSNSNDGISSAEPFATTKAAGDTIYKYPYSDAIWRVQLAAGTYTQATSFLKPFPSSRRVEFNGPSVALGTSPTAIIASPGGAVGGLFFQSFCFFQVTDIQVKDFSDTSAQGIGADANSNGLLVNVHADNCYNGIKDSQSSFMRVQGGILQNCFVAFSGIARAGFTIGSGATAPTSDGSNGPAFLNNTHAIQLQEGASGHADYTYFSGNGIDFDMSERSRTHAMGCNLIGSASSTGVRCRGGSSFYDNPTTPNTWSSHGTRTLYGAFSSDIAIEGYLAARPTLRIRRETGAQATSSTTPVTAFEHTFDAYELSTRGAGFEIEMLCSVTGVAGTKNVTVTFGGVTLLNRTVTAATTAYTIRVKFITRDGIAASSQRACCEVLENGQVPIVTFTAALTIDLKLAQTLTITHNVANAADTNRIQQFDLEVVR